MKRLVLTSFFAVPMIISSVYAQTPAPAPVTVPAPIAKESALPAAPPPPPLNVTIKDIGNGAPIPDLFAFCTPDGGGKTKNGGNLNPEISWTGAPAGTKSYALIVVDHDVPLKIEDAGKEGIVIAEAAPRQDFYHWVLVDIPPSITKINQGQDSYNWVAGGKPIGPTDHGINGQNDYAKFMKGTFGGYDGPCPPWNDERMHNYHFIVSALDVDSLHLGGAFTGKEAEEKMKGHVIAQGEVIGTYTDRPKKP